MSIFFDGDADRCYFVDEKGNIVMQDLLVCLVAEHELKIKHIQIEQLHDLRFTEEIKNFKPNGGGTKNASSWKSHLQNILKRKKGGIFGAEFSGHKLCFQNYNIDDGLFYY